MEVEHPSLKAPLKEWVLANLDPPQSPNMGCLGLEVVGVELEVVTKLSLKGANLLGLL